MKKSLLFLLILLWPLPLQAATHTAASVSYADVKTAYDACSPGDTLAIPAGSAAWNNDAETLTISKELIVQGAGISSTTITCNSTNTLMIVSLSSDVSVRITGIHFQYSTNNNGGISVLINGKNNGSFNYTKVRIDNNKFEKGSNAVYCQHWVEPLIDNNEFLNCNIAIRVLGDDNYSWDRTIAAGTANAIFIEDNTFTIDNNADREPNQLIYHQQGGRSVVRYNTFDGTAYTNANSMFYDTHGNQKYYADGTFRGQPICEVYENTFAAHHTYRMVDFRGGSMLWYNNTMTTSTGAAPYLDLTEEESWQTAFFSPLDTVWPAEDQIANCFFWGNTSNGNPITSVNLRNANDSTFIQEGRDYFMHSPQPSGVSDGYTYYDNRQGAAGNAADGTLIWDGGHANAYYPYTAYTYPHPLRGGTAVTVSNSTGGDLNEPDIVTGVTVYYTITGDTFTADSVTSGNTNDHVQAGFSSNRSETYGFTNTVQANWGHADFSLSGTTILCVWFQDNNYNPTQVEETISFVVPGAAMTSGVTQTADTFSIGVEDNPPPTPTGSQIGPGVSLSNEGMKGSLSDQGIKVIAKE